MEFIESRKAWNPKFEFVIMNNLSLRANTCTECVTIHGGALERHLIHVNDRGPSNRAIFETLQAVGQLKVKGYKQLPRFPQTMRTRFEYNATAWYGKSVQHFYVYSCGVSRQGAGKHATAVVAHYIPTDQFCALREELAKHMSNKKLYVRMMLAQVCLHAPPVVPSLAVCPAASARPRMPGTIPCPSMRKPRGAAHGCS